jgi:HSP20 family protein
MLRTDMDNVLGRWFGGTEPWMNGQVLPAFDLSETDTQLTVRMDLPGVQTKDIDLQLVGNMLTVNGSQQEEKEEKGRTWHRIERRSGSFSRSIPLPCKVEEGGIDAQCKDGVLTISMPKTKEARAQKIKVKG